MAATLCNGDNPSLQAYDQSVMREQLAVCFECEQISVFPVTLSSRSVGDSVDEAEELFCHCKMSYIEGVFMIECSNCREWFHRSCDRIPKTVTPKTTFYCSKCK